MGLTQRKIERRVEDMVRVRRTYPQCLIVSRRHLVNSLVYRGAEPVASTLSSRLSLNMRRV